LALLSNQLPKVKETTPDMTAEEAARLEIIQDEIYSKVVYFWQL
jgi:hypothetical protein